MFGDTWENVSEDNCSRFLFVSIQTLFNNLNNNDNETKNSIISVDAAADGR